MPRTMTTIGVLGIGLLLAGCGAKTTTTATPTTAAETSSVTTSAAATTSTGPALAEAALDSLLLTPAEVDTATGSTGMTVAATSKALATDIQLPAGAAPEKVACVGVAGTAEAQVYAGAGSTAVRDQALQVAGENGASRTAGQSVILFESPEKAAAFVSSSAEKWSTCREFGGSASTSTVSTVANNEGMVSATITVTNSKGDKAECQRALTAANNVVIEASACSATTSDAAVAIAKDIAGKVAKQ